MGVFVLESIDSRAFSALMLVFPLKLAFKREKKKVAPEILNAEVISWLRIQMKLFQQKKLVGTFVPVSKLLERKYNPIT